MVATDPTTNKVDMAGSAPMIRRLFPSQGERATVPIAMTSTTNAAIALPVEKKARCSRGSILSISAMSSRGTPRAPNAERVSAVDAAAAEIPTSWGSKRCVDTAQ